MKKELAGKLHNEIHQFILGIDIQFRRDLIKAIDLNFCKHINSDKIVVEDYETSYLDKFIEIRNLVVKSFNDGYSIELWDHCLMPGTANVGEFILNELRLSLGVDSNNKKTDFSPLEDGDD